MSFAWIAAIALAAELAHPQPLHVRIESFDGLPADSLSREEFMTGFREPIMADSIATETRTAAGWHPGAALPNAYAWVELGDADEVWALRIVVGLPPVVRVDREKKTDDGKTERVRRLDPSLRTSRGMNVAVTVLDPDQRKAADPPAADRTSIALSPATVGSALATSGSYVFPWREAGRTTALLVLQALHYRDARLGATSRVVLPRATRVEFR